VEVVKAEPVELEPQLPPVSPPSTKAPIQFNQQVNVYQQIPQSAWDVAGFAATVFLATNGHELIALSISLPLATILAVIVGNRFLG
jgi:hypothetical protein